MRVAIVGGPGIGKSTLIRQLGDLYHNGTYGEGEEGVWAARMLEDIAAGQECRRRHRVLRAHLRRELSRRRASTTAPIV